MSDMTAESSATPHRQCFRRDQLSATWTRDDGQSSPVSYAGGGTMVVRYCSSARNAEAVGRSPLND